MMNQGKGRGRGGLKLWDFRVWMLCVEIGVERFKSTVSKWALTRKGGFRRRMDSVYSN